MHLVPSFTSVCGLTGVTKGGGRACSHPCQSLTEKPQRGGGSGCTPSLCGLTGVTKGGGNGLDTVSNCAPTNDQTNTVRQWTTFSIQHRGTGWACDTIDSSFVPRPHPAFIACGTAKQ